MGGIDLAAELRDALGLEFRRGAVVLAALSQLEEEQYGYSLKRELIERGFDVEEGTLYPLLRRLESQELLSSRWVVEDSRPRRYYRLTDKGKRLFKQLKADWQALVSTMETVLK
jgi:DNA-binding PadR family transcriptional regulator